MQNQRVCFLIIGLLAAAMPSQAAQTCKSSITASTGHLTGKTDGTVVDGKTRLMWKRCLEGTTYASATNTCSGAALSLLWNSALTTRPAAANAENDGAGFAGYNNWRLPNIKELHSIVEERCYNPAVSETVFPGTGGVAAWSNSPATQAGASFYIDFYYGEMLSGYHSAEELGVRLVRDCAGMECN